MKKEVILQSSQVRANNYSVQRVSLLSSIKSWFLSTALMLFLASFYGRVLECRISPLQAFHLTHAQCAFFLMVLPCELPILVRVLLVVWFALTVLQCRRSGISNN